MPVSERWASVNTDFWRELRAKWLDVPPKPLLAAVPAGGASRRDGHRFTLWGTVALYHSDLAPQEGGRLCVVEDGSPTGIYLTIPEPPPVGTLLQLQIYNQAGPRGRSVVRAMGFVRWCLSQQEPKGAGVQIVDFADGEMGREAWIALARQQCPDLEPEASPATAVAPLRLPPAALPRRTGTLPRAARR
jgi:hypothetical protein